MGLYMSMNSKWKISTLWFSRVPNMIGRSILPRDPDRCPKMAPYKGAPCGKTWDLGMVILSRPST